MINFIKENKVIIILVVIYFFIFATLSSLRHYTFQTQTWDLAAFEQSFYNTVHGNLMWNNFEGTSHFAIHFSPFLLLLVPIYFVFQSPYTLLIIQSLALALGALPLYFLAKEKMEKKWAILVSLLYLLYPSLHWVNLFDFHAVPFAVPLILAAFYFIQKNNYLWSSIFLILTATVAENMIVAVFFIGVYLLLFKNRKYGLAVALLSLIYFILVAKVIMPAFGGGIVRLDRYTDFGDSATSIITGVILNPSLTLQTIFTQAKMIYLLKVFLSVAFLPFVAWQTLVLTIPGLLQNLLTTFNFQFANFYQYDSILIPFILISTALGIRKTLNKFSTKIVLGSVIFMTIAGFVWNSPLSPLNFPLPRFTDERAKVFREIVKQIPPEASVAAYTNLVPHLTHRQNINMLGHEKVLADYVIIDGDDLLGFASLEDFEIYFDNYRQAGQHEILLIDERYYILKPKK
ncbi:MAG: hypothetical protein CMI53_04990 [Parcubacteria group bacterium]|nr:hypothetical protein [Parcubacteria group bacterium]